MAGSVVECTTVSILGSLARPIAIKLSMREDYPVCPEIEGKNEHRKDVIIERSFLDNFL
jgi:hypothetical protein